jgi:hypothetical protein
MLRKDANARFESSGAWIFRRHRFVSGPLEAPRTLSQAAYKRLLAAQQDRPAPLMVDEERRRTWWMFRDDFYWEDDGYDAVAMKALLLERLAQRDRRVQRAVALMQVASNVVSDVGQAVGGHHSQINPDSDARQRRELIPDEVKVFVWNRDGGRCVRCGSQERLEFDHVIPLALGGSNTARNLQVLCEGCNRAKGASLI